MSSTVWELTIIGLLAVLAFDLALAIIRREKETSMREATAWTIFYVSAAVILEFHWVNGALIRQEASFCWLDN